MIRIRNNIDLREENIAKGNITVIFPKNEYHEPVTPSNILLKSFFVLQNDDDDNDDNSIYLLVAVVDLIEAEA